MVVLDGNFALSCGPGPDYPYTHSSMYAKMNRCYNERGTRNNYVHSSKPHRTFANIYEITYNFKNLRKLVCYRSFKKNGASWNYVHLLHVGTEKLKKMEHTDFTRANMIVNIVNKASHGKKIFGFLNNTTDTRHILMFVAQWELTK
jgi:hypothetical protein